MTDPKTSKPASPRWLVWVIVLLALLAGAGTVLSVVALVKNKGGNITVNNNVHPPEIIQDGKVKPWTPIPPDTSLDLDSVPDTLPCFGMDSIEIIPGRITITGRIGNQRNLWAFRVPADLKYAWSVYMGNPPQVYQNKLKDVPIPTSRTLLAVKLKVGTCYQSLDTVWKLRPDLAVGVCYTPWNWLALNLLELKYPPASVGVGIELNLPLVKRKGK